MIKHGIGNRFYNVRLRLFCPEDEFVNFRFQFLLLKEDIIFNHCIFISYRRRFT